MDKELKEADFWITIDKEKNILQCRLCPHFCVLKDGKFGKCKVRQNKEGILYSLVYGKPISMHVDPIEKKPLYHFLPGEKVFSIATQGCNFSCENCQNWEISQVRGIYSADYCKPEEIIEKNKEKIIAYTYTEPTIFF